MPSIIDPICDFEPWSKTPERQKHFSANTMSRSESENCATGSVIFLSDVTKFSDSPSSIQPSTIVSCSRALRLFITASFDAFGRFSMANSSPYASAVDTFSSSRTFSESDFRICSSDVSAANFTLWWFFGGSQTALRSSTFEMSAHDPFRQ